MKGHVWSVVGTGVVALLAGCADAGNPVAPHPPALAARGGGTVIPAPSNAAAVPVSTTAISLIWQDNSSNETGFQVDRSSTGATGSYGLLTLTGAGVTAYRDEGLAPSTSYCYRVRTLRRKGTTTQFSSWSAAACATTLAQPQPPPPLAPAPASGVTAVPSGSSQLTVSWIDNSSNESEFRFYRSFDGGVAWTFHGAAGSNSTSAGVAAVADQEMCVRVVASNAGGESAPSNTACETPPAAPGNLRGTWLDAETVALTWDDNSGVEDGYRVMVHLANCIGFCDAFDPLCDEYGMCPETIPIAEVAANSKSWTGRYTRRGYRYEMFFVVATRGGGISDQSMWIQMP